MHLQAYFWYRDTHQGLITINLLWHLPRTTQRQSFVSQAFEYYQVCSYNSAIVVEVSLEIGWVETISEAPLSYLGCKVNTE